MVGEEVGLHQRHGVGGQKFAEGVADIGAHRVGFRSKRQQRGNNQQRGENAEDSGKCRRLRAIERSMSESSPYGSPKMVEGAEENHLYRLANRGRVSASASIDSETR